MLVGAHHPHVGGGEDREDLVVGMAVAVVVPHADEADLRPDGPQERLLARGGAVVGHREGLGAESVRPLEKVPLGGLLDVAGQQHPPVGPRRPDHDRAVVGLAGREPVGPPRWR